MTVGYIQVKPNAVNVVAGETLFAIDFRAADTSTAIAMREAVAALLEETSQMHRITYEIIHEENELPRRKFESLG